LNIDRITVKKIYSVAKGPKFGPRAQKGPKKKFGAAGEIRGRMLPDLSIKGRKGAEFFLRFSFLL
jgi:hypothetical protein